MNDYHNISKALRHTQIIQGQILQISKGPEKDALMSLCDGLGSRLARNKMRLESQETFNLKRSVGV